MGKSSTKKRHKTSRSSQKSATRKRRSTGKIFKAQDDKDNDQDDDHEDVHMQSALEALTPPDTAPENKDAPPAEDVAVVKAEPELRCHVCMKKEEEDPDNSLIVECSKCLVAVHQSCYGLPLGPSNSWYVFICITSSVYLGAR